MNKVLFLQTGGTIDKEYPKTRLGYSFEITEAAVSRILPRARVGIDYNIVTICQKDSQDITDNDRQKMADVCDKTTSQRILITHGTDTMIETGKYLSSKVSGKTIVITGSFLPEAFKNTDADFNIGFALGALLTLSEDGVYIAMNGHVSYVSKCKRDIETDMFCKVHQS